MCASKAALCLAVALCLAGTAPVAAQVHDDWQAEGVREFARRTAAAAVADSPFNCSTFNFTQRLDHFNPADTRTWQQRYYVCNGYWHMGAREPLFAYLGAEGPLDAPYPSLFFDMIRDEGGLMLQMEHRYYGTSQPLGPVESFTNAGLRYLTVENALRDFVAITAFVRKAYGMPRTAATVAHGGSYAGSLAAWARVLHPRTFHASLASSSVVRMMMGSRSYQEIKFDTSNEMSAHVRQLGGAECTQAVDAAFGVLQGPLQWSHEGRLTLAAAASLCPNNTIMGTEDVTGLVALMRDTWWGMFQSLFRLGVDDNAVARACTTALTYFPRTPLGQLAALSNLTRTLDLDGASCIAPDALAPPFSPKQLRPDDNEWDIQYIYQNCRDGVPISTLLWSAPPSNFGRYSMPVAQFKAWCASVYEMQRPVTIPDALQYNPAAYSRTGNIIFTSGGVDPWRPGAQLTSLGPTVPALTIPGASHCMDLRSARNTTLAQVNATQAIIKRYIRRWVVDGPPVWRFELPA